jgi:WD40 repeat protein
MRHSTATKHSSTVDLITQQQTKPKTLGSASYYPSKSFIVMFSSQPAEISLGAQCRTLASVRSDKTQSRFLVGTNCIQHPSSNSIFILRFHSEANDISLDAKLSHATGSIAAMCSSPTEASVVVTAAEGSSNATLWKIPAEVMLQSSGPSYDEDESERTDTSSRDFHVTSTESMEVLTTLQADGSDLVDIVWRDAGDDGPSPGDVLTIDRKGRICQWDIGFGQAEQVHSVETFDGKTLKSQQPRITWDPHGNGNAVALTNGASVNILDWRTDTSIPSGTMGSFLAHRYAVTDLDYNPNKPFVLATAGQDSLIKFWDLRSAKQPLLVARGGHSHWAYRVMYNPFHDQLVLSSGTDSIVNLWRCSTISSAPLMTLDDNDEDDNASDTSAPNVRVDRYEHNDSVYGLCWGAADAWMYMSLGYDGKAVANQVPSKEKYKILL